jgi:FAD/FMN-containing dehydrogenase
LTIEEVHRTRLEAILRETGILSAPADMVSYAIGARYDRGEPALVLRPRTTVEVSAAVAYCARNALRLVPQSGNTGLVSGSTPDATGCEIVLSLDRMNERFELDVDNRSLRLGAGFILSEVNRRLEPHGLFFPIDLGADPRIGGMISTNTGGSRFLRYGDVRRNTLALTVVLADDDGTVLEFGSELRKNNTGIDWKHLFIGTSGAFGIVTECVLNLEFVPRQTATAYLVPKDATSVMPLLRQMETRLGAHLSAFEGMSRNAITAALAHVPSLKNPFQDGNIPDYVILAEITRTWEPRENEQPLEVVLEEVLAAIWESDDTPLADAFVGPPERMWAMRHALSEGVKHLGRLVAFDVSFKRADIMPFCEAMKRDLPQVFREVTICDFGHIGDGGVHFNLVIANDSPSLSRPGFEDELRQWVFGKVVGEYGGSFSAEHGIGRKNQKYYDLYTDGKIRGLAARLKATLAPLPMGTVRL